MGEMKVERVVKKLKRFFRRNLKMQKHQIPRVVLNIGDPIHFSSALIKPLVILEDEDLNCKVQIVLVDWLERMEEAFNKMKRYKGFKFEKGTVFLKKKFLGSVYDFLALHLIFGMDKFWSYRDFRENNDDIWMGYSKMYKTYYKWSHREARKFKISDVIKQGKKYVDLTKGGVGWH